MGIVQVMRRGLVVMTALSFCAAPTWAQMELGVMQGTVKDENGQPLADVSFRIIDVQRGRESVVKSDKSGKFYRRGLPAVEYDIVVEKEGYQPIKDRIKLAAGMDRRFDFKLAKAAAAGASEFADGVKAFNAGDFQRAAQAFESAVEKQPDIPDLRVNLALAYFRLNRTADAVAQLEKAASLKPGDAHLLFQLGSAYVEMKDLPRAASSLEQGLARATDTSDPLVYEAHVTLGAVYFAQSAADKAQQQYEQALAQQPTGASALVGLGKIQFSKGDSKSALANFEKVVAAHPGTPQATEAAAFIAELTK